MSVEVNLTLFMWKYAFRMLREFETFYFSDKRLLALSNFSNLSHNFLDFGSGYTYWRTELEQSIHHG